jgi:hypothetical protein
MRCGAVDGGIALVRVCTAVGHVCSRRCMTQSRLRTVDGTRQERPTKLTPLDLVPSPSIMVRRLCCLAHVLDGEL